MERDQWSKTDLGDTGDILVVNSQKNPLLPFLSDKTNNCDGITNKKKKPERIHPEQNNLRPYNKHWNTTHSPT